MCPHIDAGNLQRRGAEAVPHPFIGRLHVARPGANQPSPRRWLHRTGVCTCERWGVFACATSVFLYMREVVCLRVLPVYMREVVCVCVCYQCFFVHARGGVCLRVLPVFFECVHRRAL
jgi:hypothetical protein